MYICGLGPGAFGNTKQKINSNGFRKKKIERGVGETGQAELYPGSREKYVFRVCFTTLFLSSTFLYMLMTGSLHESVKSLPITSAKKETCFYHTLIFSTNGRIAFGREKSNRN